MRLWGHAQQLDAAQVSRAGRRITAQAPFGQDALGVRWGANQQVSLGAEARRGPPGDIQAGIDGERPGRGSGRARSGDQRNECGVTGAAPEQVAHHTR